MTPRNTLAEHYGIMQADEIVEQLRAAGYIIVRKGAIGQAQREAVAAWREDNANHSGGWYREAEMGLAQHTWADEFGAR